jgi:hypothetical protein
MILVVDWLSMQYHAIFCILADGLALMAMYAPVLITVS